MTHYKKIILLIVGIMYGLPTYTMNGNLDKTSKKLLDSCFYATPSNIDLLKTMLTYKANPNIQDIHGNTPLHLAAIREHPAYLSILLAAGAQPNKQNNNKKTPLHYAAREKQFTSIQLLLNYKANPNLVDSDENTPLHGAITDQVSIPTVELLLSANANPNIKNIGGNTPLHCTVLSFYLEQPEMIKIAQLLLQYGAQVDNVNNQQLTPLQLLVTNYYNNSYSLKTLPIARKMGRLLVWYQYILLPHFIKHVPEKAHACAIASHVALICAEQPTIWP